MQRVGTEIMKRSGRLNRRYVFSIHRERRTEYHGIPMYELNLDVKEHGIYKNVDVMLMEEDYTMIQERGYYLC